MDPLPTCVDEEVLLHARVMYRYAVKRAINTKKKSSKMKAQVGTLAVTNARLAFYRSSSLAVSISIPFTTIHHWQVSKPTVSKVMLKVETLADKQRKEELLSSSKKINANQFGYTFVFTSPSALCERDAFRDLIVQLHLRWKTKSQEEETSSSLSGGGAEGGGGGEGEKASVVLNSNGDPVKLRPIKNEPGTEASATADSKPPTIAKPKSASGYTRSLDLTKLADAVKRVPRTGEHSDASPNALPGLSISEAKQRAALIASDTELKGVYDHLVGNGVLSAEEFWASRREMLDEQSQRSAHQLRGLPTALTADVRPAMETINAVHYKLTPTVIRQIFLEHPSVQRAYSENVPDKISEVKFWEKYFQSQYFHRDRHSGGNLKTAHNPEDDLFAACAQEDDELLRVESERCIELLHRVEDPSTNLTVDHRPTQGHGVAPDSDALVDPSDHAAQQGLSLIRRYNRHAALVLRPHETMSITADAERKRGEAGDAKRTHGPLSMDSRKRARLGSTDSMGMVRLPLSHQSASAGGKNSVQHDGGVHRGSTVGVRSTWRDSARVRTSLSELEQERGPRVTRLHIQDQRVYFEGRALESPPETGGSAAPTGGNAERAQRVGAFQKRLAGWNPPGMAHDANGKDESPGSSVALESSLASGVLQDLSKRSETRRMRQATFPRDLDRHPVTLEELQNDPDFHEELFDVFHTANELMRHFWGAYPLTSATLAAKANRVIAAISCLYDQIQELKNSLPREHRNRYGQLLRPIIRSLDKVIEKHQSQSAF